MTGVSLALLYDMVLRGNPFREADLLGTPFRASLLREADLLGALRDVGLVALIMEYLPGTVEQGVYCLLSAREQVMY